MEPYLEAIEAMRGSVNQMGTIPVIPQSAEEKTASSQLVEDVVSGQSAAQVRIDPSNPGSLPVDSSHLGQPSSESIFPH